jgi:hypothetical protein
MSQSFRVPVAGSINQRVSATNILNSVSGYVGLGIVGGMIVGKTSGMSTKDQRFVNCFSETIVDAITGQPAVYMIKRPGFATSITTATADLGAAILIWTGYGSGDSVISAFGATNSTIYNGTTSLGAITGVATGITETFVSGVPTLCVTSSDNTGWYYDVPTGVMTKIVDADFPGNAGETLAGTFAHIDGFAIVMDTTGNIWASDLNSVTSWTATSVGLANAYPDNGIGCVRNRNLQMVFGTESLEFWQNSGLTPFPLSRVNSMTQKVGCVSATAIAQIADTTFWCGSSPQGGLSVFQFDTAIGRISTPEIDQILVLAGASNISLTTIRFYGRSFVIVKASTVALCYCIEEKMWHEWNSSTAPWYKIVGISKGSTMVNFCISNTLPSGIVYSMNPSALVFTDAGAAYTALMQLDNMELGTANRKFWEELRIIGDQQSASSPIQLSYSDDDYQTFTTWGTLDMADPMPRATRLGSSRRRAWVLQHSDNSPMRIRLLEGRAEIGAS